MEELAKGIIDGEETTVVATEKATTPFYHGVS